MSTVIYHQDDAKGVYFFSTSHMQQTEKSFVAMTSRDTTVAEIKRIMATGNMREIPNPDSFFAPLKDKKQ